MHVHISLQEFVILIFSVGTPFIICCYCCFKCTDKYCEIDNREDFEDDDEFSEELPEYNRNETESNIISDLSPRTIRVINKYGHFKPDYSSDSEYTSGSDYTSESNSQHDYSSEDDIEITHEREVPPIPRAYG
tara:strand:+ start:3169 stop:3567 length:399 start_codon:yes stop_codon:yes gene_type:complete